MDNAMTDTKTVEQIDAEMKALADQRKALLEEKKDSDLELVRKLCKQHGFTATQLRSSLKTKGKATKTTTAKKTPAKKTTKAK